MLTVWKGRAGNCELHDSQLNDFGLETRLNERINDSSCRIDWRELNLNIEQWNPPLTATPLTDPALLRSSKRDSSPNPNKKKLLMQ